MSPRAWRNSLLLATVLWAVIGLLVWGAAEAFAAPEHTTVYPQFARGVAAARLTLSKVSLNEHDVQTFFPGQPGSQGSPGTMVAVWAGVDDGNTWIQAGITKEAGRKPYIYFETRQGPTYKLLNLGPYTWGQEVSVRSQHSPDGTWSMVVNGHKLGAIRFHTYNIRLAVTGESRYLPTAPTLSFDFAIHA